MSEPLSDEREATIRAWLDSSVVGVGEPRSSSGEPVWSLLTGEQAVARDLLAEVDRLRAALQEAEEARDGLKTAVDDVLAWETEQQAATGAEMLFSLSLRLGRLRKAAEASEQVNAPAAAGDGRFESGASAASSPPPASPEDRP